MRYPASVRTLLVLALVAAGCSRGQGSTTGVTSGWVAPGATAATGCHVLNGLPDRRCTPGAADPSVTQANIDSTICVSGYSAAVRPPVSVTEPIKRSEMLAYGLSEALSLVELDHLIPLSVGGAPASVANLWPEQLTGADGARAKDVVELRLHALVCAHQVLLAVAQQAIATNWEAAARHYPGSPVDSSGTSD